MKKRLLYIVALIALGALLVACGAPRVDLPPVPDHGGIGVRVISATEWYDYHPEVVTSFFNSDRTEFYSYLELNPYKRVLFEGFGFALDYNSPRNHTFAMEGLDMTGRYGFRARSNCFTCKSANYPAIREYMGVEFYAVPFEEMRAMMTQPVSCFNCHGNEPGVARAMAPYLHAALPTFEIAMISPGSIACAQCHVEYHFDPNTFEVILPWQGGLATMYPTDVLYYFNNIARDATGTLAFADYVNPRSGVRQIKVQHPEFETIYGRGAVHNSLAPLGMAFSCADCHMPHAEARGVEYRSHNWVSPLNSPELIAGSCAACHTDLYSEVRAIQARYYPAIHGFGQHLAELMERLVLAVESGRHSEATLDEIRYTFRNAQFFWDWVVSENSNGAHNSRLLFRTMEYGWDYAREVERLLQQIGH
ncbi:MAG: ammonia-forming cytochrome c nitrite reductase subunit c552 [Defluviitaleaceae bacterium]|nr:ammonia-forming cytochrome c nitrite reductase subunit c552 [Defluviitaleaceae bacterium]